MAKEAGGDNSADLFAVRSTDVKQKLGYTSWDDFFTRKFKPCIRPVASPDDDDVRLLMPVNLHHSVLRMMYHLKLSSGLRDSHIH